MKKYPESRESKFTKYLTRATWRIIGLIIPLTILILIIVGLVFLIVGIIYFAPKLIEFVLS